MSFFFSKTLSFFSFLLSASRSLSQVLVAHTGNPSYSGGRDQEDGSSFEASLGK
jgi:hypothetical protein